MASVVCGSLRWSLTQILLQKEQLGMTNPIISLFYLTPISFTSMLTWSLISEKFYTLFINQHFFGSYLIGLKTLGIVLAGGFIAFFMILVEFALISKSSILTLAVAGILKVIVYYCSFQNQENIV